MPSLPRRCWTAAFAAGLCCGPCLAQAPRLELRSTIELRIPAPATCLAYTADGRRLISVGQASTVVVRDAATLELEIRRSFAPGRVDPPQVTDLLVAADGVRAVAALGQLVDWRIGSHSVRRGLSSSLRGLHGPIAGSADLGRLAVVTTRRPYPFASRRDVVSVLDAGFGVTKTVEGEGLAPVRDLALSADGARLAIAGPRLRVADLSSGQVEEVLAEEVERVAFHADGRLWTLSGGTLAVDGGRVAAGVRSFGLGPGRVQAACATDDDEVVLLGSDGDVRSRRRGREATPLALTVRPGSDDVAVSYADGVVLVLRGDDRHELVDFTARPRTLAFSRDGSHLIVGGGSRFVRVDPAGGRSTVLSPDAAAAGAAPATASGGEIVDDRRAPDMTAADFVTPDLLAAIGSHDVFLVAHPSLEIVDLLGSVHAAIALALSPVDRRVAVLRVGRVEVYEVVR